MQSVNGTKCTRKNAPGLLVSGGVQSQILVDFRDVSEALCVGDIVKEVADFLIQHVGFL